MIACAQRNQRCDHRREGRGDALYHEAVAPEHAGRLQREPLLGRVDHLKALDAGVHLELLAEFDDLPSAAAQREGEPPVYALEGAVSYAGALIQWLRDNLEMGLS